MEHAQSAGKLIAILHHEGRKFVDKSLCPLGLGAGQFPILMQLYHQDGISQDVIAKRIGIDRTTLARTIVKLEDKGFILRIADPDDHRAYKVKLTVKGESVREEFLKVLKLWTEKIYGDLSEEERVLFYALLTKAVANVKDMPQ